MESNSSNKNLLWVSLAGLGLLSAVAVYALNNSPATDATVAEKSAAARTTTSTRSSSNPSTSSSSTVTLPAGTTIDMILQTSLTTKTAAVGDRFTARVSSPVVVNGRTIVPSGAIVSGHVALTEQPGKASGRGHMQLSYDTVRFGGRSYEMSSVSRIYASESGRGKDAAIIGGGAVAGGVVGAIVGGSAGDAGKGAAAGAVAGTAASLLTRGPQLQLDEGTALEVTLDQPVTVRPSATS